MKSGALTPHEPLSVFVSSQPDISRVFVASTPASRVLSPQKMSCWCPVAGGPWGQGAQLGMSRLRIQRSTLNLIGAVQPWSLVTCPVQSQGVVQLVETVQVARTVFSGMNTSPVLAQSPLDTAE
jgi:hypothetical protein